MRSCCAQVHHLRRFTGVAQAVGAFARNSPRNDGRSLVIPGSMPDETPREPEGDAQHIRTSDMSASVADVLATKGNGDGRSLQTLLREAAQGIKKAEDDDGLDPEPRGMCLPMHRVCVCLCNGGCFCSQCAPTFLCDSGALFQASQPRSAMGIRQYHELWADANASGKDDDNNELCFAALFYALPMSWFSWGYNVGCGNECA